MEIEKKAGFDASKPFVVPILSGGEKTCEVRFPSDEEWCAWARAQRTVRHFLGRGKSQSEDVDLPKINAEIYDIEKATKIEEVNFLDEELYLDSSEIEFGPFYKLWKGVGAYQP